MSRRTVVVATLGALVTLTAVSCGGDDELERVTAYDGSTRPVLLVAPPADGGDAAHVVGELGVNRAGCYTVGGYVLVAPDGSEIVGDGTGVDVPGVGEVLLGQVFDAGGGFGDRELAEQDPVVADCLARRSRGVVYIAPAG